MLSHKKFRANGTLIVPYWLSTKFWQALVNNEGNFELFVKDYRLFGNAKSCMVITKSPYCVLKNLKTKLYA